MERHFNIFLTLTNFKFCCVEFISIIYYLKYWFTFIHSETFPFRLKVCEKSHAISCRAVWSKNDHNEAQLICQTRYLLEEQIRQISGIQFFLSCITETTTNTKILSNIARPEIAYFILCRKNSKANETILFSCLHDTGMDASVTRISSNKKLLDEECAMIQGLKQVVKVTKIIFSYFKRTQRQFRNPVRHTIWTSFVKKESIAFKLLTIVAKT